MGALIGQAKMGSQFPIGQIRAPIPTPASSVVDIVSGKSGKKTFDQYRYGIAEAFRNQPKPTIFSGL